MPSLYSRLANLERLAPPRKSTTTLAQLAKGVLPRLRRRARSCPVAARLQGRVADWRRVLLPQQRGLELVLPQVPADEREVLRQILTALAKDARD